MPFHYDQNSSSPPIQGPCWQLVGSLLAAAWLVQTLPQIPAFAIVALGVVSEMLGVTMLAG